MTGIRRGLAAPCFAEDPYELVELGVAGVIGLGVGAHGYVGRYLAADNPPDRALYAMPAVSRGT